MNRTLDLTHPVTGEQVLATRSGVDADGDFIEGLSVLPPTLASSSYHEHPHQAERLSVVSGTVLLRIEGELQVLGPGASVDIPAGTAHEVANTGSEHAEVIWQLRPALRTDAYLRASFGDRRTSTISRISRAVDRLSLAAEFSDEYRTATLPWMVQRPVFAMLKWATRHSATGRRTSEQGRKIESIGDLGAKHFGGI